MTAQLPPAERPRNPHTEALHKRDTFWQIYFPMWLALLAVIAVCIMAALSAFADGGAVGRLWADISLVFLVLQAMMFALPLLILFGGLAYGVGYVIPKLPPYFKIAQDYAALAASEVKRLTRYVEEPVLQFKGGVAGFDQFVQSVRRFFRFK
jgi:ABC-type dipeptide/oligopeptide/nickel transport system permease subunit